MSFMGQDQRRPAPFSLTRLAWDLHDLLELPRTSRVSAGGHDYVEPETGRLIVRTILRTMVRALRNLEPVVIEGLGTFRVVRARDRRVYPFTGRGSQRLPVLERYRGGLRVVFDPEPGLLEPDAHDRTASNGARS